MCLLAIQYRLVSDSPILVAANREEFFDHRSSTPSIQSGKPRILSPQDDRAGGTWVGVNQHGMFVGLGNRRTATPTIGLRARTLLCKEVLRCTSARKGIEKAKEELSMHAYESLNLVVADKESGWVVHHEGEDNFEVREMRDGLNVIGIRDMNDPRDERVQMARRLLTLQTLDSPVKFLAVASKVFARGPAAPGRPSMVIRGNDYGTISSALLALGTKPRDAIFQYADGPADKVRYEDYSPMLRDILSRGLREARAKVVNS